MARGGAREGTGPSVARIELGEESRRELRIITLARLGRAGKEQSRVMVEALIHKAWLDYNAGVEPQEL